VLIPRTEHVAARPAWDCRACGRTWPCATAKVELAEQYRGYPTALTVYLASTMVEVIEDLAAGPVGGSGRPARAVPRLDQARGPAVTVPAVLGTPDD
jgi:hypothetical protein